MGFSEKILKSFGYEKKPARKRDRGFDAAKHSRLQASWGIGTDEINRVIKNDNPALISRMREMRYNNPIIAGFIRNGRLGIVGPQGFDLQPMVKRSGGEDLFANDVIKRNFDRWGEEDYCTPTGRIDFLTMQHLVSDSLLESGMFVVRMLYSGEPVANNPFGFAIELMDVMDIDMKYNEDLPNGSAVIMGVKLDKWRRLEGIYFKKKRIYDEIGMGYGNYGERVFVPGSDLIVGFDMKYYKQVFGITDFVSVLVTLKDMDMWETYSLQNAKAAASKMGFLTKSNDAIGEYTGVDSGSSMEGGNPGKYMDFEASIIEELPYGYDFKAFDSKFPTDQHSSYERSLGRRIATGLGRDYGATFGDRENESFSSIRDGELKERQANEYMQSIIRTQFLKRLYKNWLKYSLANGALKPLTYESLERYMEHYWAGYVKPYSDPNKEMNAFEKAEKNGYMSKTQIVAQMGNRYEDILKDRQAEKELEKKYGVVYETGSGGSVGKATVAE